MSRKGKMRKARCKVLLLYSEKNHVNAYFMFLVALGMLLQTASDKNTNVVDAIHTSLLKIADNNTNEVLLACCSSVEHATDKNHDNTKTVLTIMERICEDHIQKIDGASIVAIIQLTVRIMKENNEYEQVQQPASDVLVALGREHCVLVSKHFKNFYIK